MVQKGLFKGLTYGDDGEGNRRVNFGLRINEKLTVPTL